MIRKLFTLCATGMLAFTSAANAVPPSSAHESNGHLGPVQKTRPAANRPNNAPNNGGNYGRPYNGGRYYYGRPYYGRGYGYGFATGAGFGYLFSSGGYGSIPGSMRGGYNNASNYSAVPAYPNSPNDDPSMNPSQTGSESGLQITEVLDGPAKQGHLRAGDIILGIGPTQTQTFDELQNALSASKGKVEVVFINHESKNVEKLPITPVNGKLGVAVVPIAVR